MKFKCLVLTIFLAMLLSACANPAPTDDILPIVDDPDLEINVTPQPEE